MKALHPVTILRVAPMAKPRMTRADRWKHRKCVARYWAWCDAIRLSAQAQRFTVPPHGYHVTFFLPMPKSWSAKKKTAHNGQPHKQRPDKDNLEKAFLDALLPDDDSHIWDGRATKRWSCDPRIEIEDCVEEHALRLARQLVVMLRKCITKRQGIDARSNIGIHVSDLEREFACIDLAESVPEVEL